MYRNPGNRLETAVGAFAPLAPRGEPIALTSQVDSEKGKTKVRQK